MKRRNFLSKFLIGNLSFFILSCTTVPVTNRRQLNLTPDKYVRWFSDNYYYKFLDDNYLYVMKDKIYMKRIRSIGDKIQKGIEKYFAIENLDFSKYQLDYEINVIKDKRTLNAFAMANAKTHPSPENREKNILNWSIEVKEKYKNYI